MRHTLHKSPHATGPLVEQARRIAAWEPLFGARKRPGMQGFAELERREHADFRGIGACLKRSGRETRGSTTVKCFVSN
jgi:hypothetical protein